MNLPPLNSDSSLTIMKAIMKDPYRYERRLIEALGDIHQAKIFGRTCYSISHPDHMKHVLLDKMDNYIRPQAGIFSQKAFIEYCGNPNNLRHTTDHEFWKNSSEAVMAAFFSKGRYREYVPLIIKLTLGMAEAWGEKIKAQEPVDVKEDLLYLGSQCVMYCLLDNLEIDFDRFYKEKSRVFAQMGKRGVLPTWLYFILPSSDKTDWREGLSYMQAFSNQLIEERLKLKEQPNDLLGGLIMAFKDEPNHQKMIEDLNSQLRMYVVTSETLASGLNHTLAIFSQQPAIQQRVVAELETTLSGRDPAFEDVQQLTYLNCVIKEMLRYRSPAPLLTRVALEDDQMGDYLVPKDTLIFLRHFWAHRHPGFWDNPEGFQPERFVSKPWGQDHEYAYTPFSGGPRSCIGGRFSMLVYAVVLAILAQRYRFKLLPGVIPSMEGLAISWPSGAERMMVEEIRNQ